MGTSPTGSRIRQGDAVLREIVEGSTQDQTIAKVPKEPAGCRFPLPGLLSQVALATSRLARLSPTPVSSSGEAALEC